MRRYLVILMMPCFVMLFGICCLAGCEGSKHHLKKVRLNEVAHSIFYAPQYVAIEKGYFEKEGIELELTTGFGADKTATAVISGDADIAFMARRQRFINLIRGMQIILSILPSLLKEQAILL